MTVQKQNLLCTYLVLVKDSQLLMLRRSGTGFMDGYYGLVSGRLDGRETFRQAMAREAKEEANIDLDPNDLEMIHVLHRGQHYEDGYAERVDIFFKTKKWGGEIRNMEPDKHDKLEWIDMDNLPDNTMPFVKQAIGSVLKNEKYGEWGFDNI